MRFLLLLLVCLSAQAQPLPPELYLSKGGRFEFAPIPELVFVRGIPETQQLGAFVLDPSNRWAPGDFGRQSGWRSTQTTRIVDSAGQAVPGVVYDGDTGELGYLGLWSGDVTARLETASGHRSNEFRIRVLTPSVVFGVGAAETSQNHGWNAAICENVTFATCRSRFKGGSTDAAPLVLFFTPGRYESTDWFIGERRFAYVLGDARDRPQLVRGELSNARFEIWQVRNIRQVQSRLVQGAARSDVPSKWIISNVHQCCETADRNGIVNPNGTTAQPWSLTLWNFDSEGMGNQGNGRHAIYIEGRPKSTLEIINSRFRGSKGSSSVKTTMQNVAIRYSEFCVDPNCSDVPNPALKLTHTPVDIPAPCNVTIYGNRFEVWQQTTQGVPSGESGVLTASIFLRLRQQGMKGSDIPAYPNLSWDPPRTSQTTMSSPGPGWSAGPETYTDDAFWAAVKAKPITDPENGLTFKHFIGFNEFVQLPGSKPVWAFRDDGTHAAEPVVMFGPDRKLWVHPDWVERSVTFFHGNTFSGHTRLIQLKDSQYTPEIQAPKCKDAAPGLPCSKWPRSDYDPDEVYPHAVTLEDLPEWFRL